MRVNLKIQGLLLVTVVLFISCNMQKENTAKEIGNNVVALKVIPFNLTDVTLLDGPFKHATELNINTLLNYQPDRLLAKFRIEAGLKPKAEAYGGWEAETLAGHSLGHYLSACCLMFQSTGDTVFLNRVNYIVSELDECQKQDSLGYIGAVPGARKVFMDEIAKGNIRAKGFDLNGIWAPLYTQHKELAGLLDAYQLCGNTQALELAKKFADWMIYYSREMSDEQLQEMMNCEIGGINESLAELYGITQDTNYLNMANRLYHKAILEPLSKGIDILPGKHANTQIPKLIGLSRNYELTGDSSFRETAEFFWDRVVNHHSYVTGGHCDHEYFGPPDTLRNRLSEGTTESCNVYNMLKLSQHIFEWEASATVADFYERALFNHILSAQHPVSGKVIYNLSLEMGGFKEYQDPEWFTCCVGTGMEIHAKHQGNIYYHNTDELYVSQFIASKLHWKEKGLTLHQHTQFPNQQQTTIEFTVNEPQSLSVFIRYPYWANQNFAITVNGKPQKIKSLPGSFIEINRKWYTGDKIEVQMPFTLRLEEMPDDSNRVAVMFGPLVLAGDLGTVEDEHASDPLFVPVLMTTNREPETWLTPVEGKTNTFITQQVGRPRDVVMKPFFELHDRRYTIYWDLFSEERWQQFQEAYNAELAHKKALEEMTVDFFQPGEMQPERDHKFVANQSWVGQLKHRKFREVHNGWFSCEMKTLPNIPMALVVDYWGAFPGSKTFDILVNEVKIATQNISNMNDGQFEDIKYSIPESITKGKSHVTIKFRAHEGHRAGPVFGVRTIKSTSL